VSDPIVDGVTYEGGLLVIRREEGRPTRAARVAHEEFSLSGEAIRGMFSSTPEEFARMVRSRVTEMLTPPWALAVTASSTLVHDLVKRVTGVDLLGKNKVDP